MIVRTAWRELSAHRLRTAFAVAGLAVATALLLDMLMLSGGLQRSFSDLLRGAGYQLRVAPAGTLPLDTDATIGQATALITELRARPEIETVAPVLAANLTEGPEGAGRVFALGVDPAEQGVLRLVSGSMPRNDGEVVVGRELASADKVIGTTLSLAAPSTLGRLGSGAARSYRVVGVAEFIYASASERPVALRLGDLQNLTGRAGEASFLMLRAVEELDASVVAARLRSAHPEVEIVAIGEVVERAEERLSYFRQLAVILGSVSMVVMALLVGTIAAVSMNDRFGTIAAVRALGVSRRSILATLSLESVFLAGTAGAAGVGLGLLTASYLERILADFPGLPAAIRFFVLEPGMLGVTIIALLVTALTATAIPALRVTRLPIATTLHQEEP